MLSKAKTPSTKQAEKYQDYKQWRLNQLGRGARYKALQDKIAQRMTDAHEAAVAYVNDAIPGIYSLNRNYAAYTIERVAGNIGFTLWDARTARRLITERPNLMPYYPKAAAVRRGIDLEYGKKQITKCVTSSILQGKSIKGISDDLQRYIPTMSRDSAIRTARTAVTGAQNAGRMDSYADAEKKGIRLKKEWVATLDNRTRHAHAMLDGQKVGANEPFKVDGYKLMFPGDQSAPGYLIYNCRCTTVSDVDGVDTSDAMRRAIDPVTGESVLIKNMTYQEWADWKRSENVTAWDTYIKKGRNASVDRRQMEEYRAVLGNKVPNNLDAFQKLKYNEPGKWKALKTIKKQTDFVNKAPCVTTPKKYTGYFLKQGAKHADQFFNVGYTADNPLQLRYDMSRQFDISKAVNMSVDESGRERFRIYMDLGIENRKRFRTAWIKDSPDSKPRIVTAFREDD